MKIERKKIRRSAFALLLTLSLLLASCGLVRKPESGTKDDEDRQIAPVETGIASISKYGNIVLTADPEHLAALGYEPADLVLVTIGQAAMQMPIGTAYSDVDSGEPICCCKTSSKGEREVVLAINSGNLAEAMKIAAVRRVEEDPGYECLFAEGYGPDTPVVISMVEKQGFAGEYALHQLGGSRTNKRADYADLSDEEYANFRAAETTGMGKYALFRSSSPVNPVLNRSAEADAAIGKYGVRTVFNMADSDETLRAYPGYGGSHYAACSVIALNMGMDYTTADYRAKLAEGFRFFAAQEGPYLVHCVEGKDRTGFAAAILEALMGGSEEEILRDYMLTYRNFYGVTEESEVYRPVAESNLLHSLASAFGLLSLDRADLAACAEEYLRGIGLDGAEIAALKENLSKNYPAPQA